MIEYLNPACNVMLINVYVIDCPRQYIIMGRCLCALLASDTYDYETLSRGLTYMIYTTTNNKTNVYTWL